ncbi:MAG: hypothetical protein ABEJ43_01280 [Haloferacaceae archaeon]
MRDRGQAYTLEAFVAALLVLSGVVFALQATAVTPLSASTSNQHVGNQERALADGLMRAAEANGTLTEAVVDWNATTNTTDGRFVGVSPNEDAFSNAGPPNAFGRALNESFGDQQTAFNVVLRYRGTDGTLGSQTMVNMGTPSDDATVATRSVVLYDDTTLTTGGTVSAPGPAGNGTFYAPDAEPEGPLFNVVEVRVTVWRI